MRVVLDSNVIVSGLNFSGNERRVLELAQGAHFELYLSTFILREVAGVLRRKFRWSDERLAHAERTLREVATIVEPRQVPLAIQGNHPDNSILACAVEASADYLITGDSRHLLPLGQYRNTKLTNAQWFLAFLGEALGHTDNSR